MYFSKKHYTKGELMVQTQSVLKRFPDADYRFQRGRLVLKLLLKPTEESITYTVVFRAREGIRGVDIFVTDPKVEIYYNNELVPHLYPNGSLCLYYPKYNEWDYRDSWADTLVPWTSLWLYYYEIWQETGEWLGGGVHNKRTENKS